MYENGLKVDNRELEVTEAPLEEETSIFENCQLYEEYSIEQSTSSPEKSKEIIEECTQKETTAPPISTEKKTARKCTQCDKIFWNLEALTRHSDSYHVEHRCPICNKLFKNKFSLRYHADVHAERRNFCCHICGHLFRTASCLCNHIRAQHGSPQSFECPHCSKLFRQAYHLVQHMRTHTGERPFACSECPKRFTTRCQLTRHVEGRHQRLKKYECEECGKGFLYSSNYKAHLLLHQGQKTLQCADCEKSFVNSNGLLRHRRLHTGEKPFECTVCGRRFSDCSNRRRHMAQHTAGPRAPRASRSNTKRAIVHTAKEAKETKEPHTFTSLRAFLESSEVAEALGGGEATENVEPLSSNTELVTLMAGGDGDLQQMIVLPAGLLDILPEVGKDLELDFSATPVPTSLVDKEDIVRMLNSQGTTIAGSN